MGGGHDALVAHMGRRDLCPSVAAPGLQNVLHAPKDRGGAHNGYSVRDAIPVVGMFSQTEATFRWPPRLKESVLPKRIVTRAKKHHCSSPLYLVCGKKNNHVCGF
jgi:hypothetical protein